MDKIKIIILLKYYILCDQLFDKVSKNNLESY